MKQSGRGKFIVLAAGTLSIALGIVVTTFFGDNLARQYRIWRLSLDPSLVLKSALAPSGDPWRIALEDLLVEEYPIGLWRPRQDAVPAATILPRSKLSAGQASVNGNTKAADFVKYLSDQSGAPVFVGDAKLLEREAWTAGVIEVLDVGLARAILHARGIAVLQLEEDGQQVLWAVDRSDLRRGEER